MKLGIALFLATTYLQTLNAAESRIPCRDLPSLHYPLYLKRDSLEYWEYSTAGELIFNNGDTIDLYCKRGFKMPRSHEKFLTANYLSGYDFRINGGIYNLSTVECEDHMEVETQGNNSCPGEGNTYNLIKIGYDLGARGFKTVYEVCFDFTYMTTKYVKYTFKQVPQKSCFVSQGLSLFKDLPSFTGYEFKSFYTNYRLDGKVVSRGHLAPNADFFYSYDRIATYIFPNAAPQLQQFNGGNWREVEDFIKKKIGSSTFQSYTGVIGVMPYKTVPALYLDSNNQKIPVPKLYFRVVYEEESQKAIVFLGSNNIFVNTISADHLVCNNVINRIKGLRGKRILTNTTFGYVYACEFNDFQSQFTYVPRLNVNTEKLLFEN